LRKYRYRNRRYFQPKVSVSISAIIFASIVNKPAILDFNKAQDDGLAVVPAGTCTFAAYFRQITMLSPRSFRLFHQGRRLTVGSLSTCLQLLPALRLRHGPVHNSPLTLGLVLFVYRAQLSRRVSLAECRVRASYWSAGPCHLLSAPAAFTTPRRPRSRCDGLSQFNEDTGGPSNAITSSPILFRPDAVRQNRVTHGSFFRE